MTYADLLRIRRELAVDQIHSELGNAGVGWEWVAQQTKVHGDAVCRPIVGGAPAREEQDLQAGCGRRGWHRDQKRQAREERRVVGGEWWAESGGRKVGGRSVKT